MKNLDRDQALGLIMFYLSLHEHIDSPVWDFLTDALRSLGVTENELSQQWSTLEELAEDPQRAHRYEERTRLNASLGGKVWEQVDAMRVESEQRLGIDRTSPAM